MLLERPRTRLAMSCVLALLLVTGCASKPATTARFPDYKDKTPKAVARTLPPPPHRTVYTIDAAFQEAPTQIKGSETITYFNNTEQPLDTIYLRLFPNADIYKWDIGPGGEADTGKPLDPPGSLQMTNLHVDGQEGHGSQPDPTTLKLPLGRNLAPGDKVSVRMDFTTAIPRSPSLGRLSFNGSAVELGYWYPLVAVKDQTGWRLDPMLPIGDSVLTEVADFDVTLHLPSGWTGLTTGLKAPPPGEVLQANAQNMRDFGVFLAKGWERPLAAEVDGVHVLLAAPPGFRDAAKVQQVTADTLLTFNKLFGKYPYDSLAVAVGAGTEEPGIAVAAEVAPQGDRVLVHTVAHQWWYAAVGDDKVRNVWDEGLVSYSETLYKDFGNFPIFPWKFNQTKGKANTCLNRTLYWFWNEGGRTGQALNNYLSTEYDGGARWFADLRSQMGDQQFFETLRRFYADHKFGVATWDDWRAALNGQFPDLARFISCSER